MNVIGIALFVAGYQQTRRQADYITTQAVPVKAIYTTKSVSLPAKIKHTFAFRLAKPA